MTSGIFDEPLHRAEDNRLCRMSSRVGVGICKDHNIAILEPMVSCAES